VKSHINRFQSQTRCHPMSMTQLTSGSQFTRHRVTKHLIVLAKAEWCMTSGADGRERL